MSRTYAFGFYKSVLLARAEKLRWQFCKDGPPYDPFKIAEGLRVKVTMQPLHGMDGYTETGQGDCAVINSGASLTRRRFTLAHELGHVVLFRTAQAGLPLDFGRLVSNDRPHQDPAEEALCNEFAAALLLPREEVKSHVANRRITPDIVLSVANSFGTSMHASARRLISLTDPSGLGISYWQVLDEDWPVPVWTTGLSTRVNAAMKKVKSSVADATRDHIEHVTYWQATRCSHHGRMTGLTIHVAPVPSRHCLAVIAKKSGFGMLPMQAKSYDFSKSGPLRERQLELEFSSQRSERTRRPEAVPPPKDC